MFTDDILFLRFETFKEPWRIERVLPESFPSHYQACDLGQIYLSEGQFPFLKKRDAYEIITKVSFIIYIVMIFLLYVIFHLGKSW